MEKFGYRQGCVCWDLLSRVVETYPLVWELPEPIAAERGIY